MPDGVDRGRRDVARKPYLVMAVTQIAQFRRRSWLGPCLLGFGLLGAAGSAGGATAPGASVLDLPAEEFHARRQRAIAGHPDGLVIFGAATEPKTYEQHGFLQRPNFYYFTGLGSALGAIVVMDGPRKESWLFVPGDVNLPGIFKQHVLIAPGAETAQRLRIEHVEDWTRFAEYMDRRLREQPGLVIYTEMRAGPATGPPGFGRVDDTWVHALQSRWPSASVREATRAIALRNVKSEVEVRALRAASRLSADSLRAVLQTVAPGRTTRELEGEGVAACTRGGGNGIYFWPFLGSGDLAGYDRLRPGFVDYRAFAHTLRGGDLFRIDVGCDVDRYKGDVGRTVPVSGVFSPEQREVHDMMIEAYRAGLAVMKDGVEPVAVRRAFLEVIERRAPAVRTTLGRRAVDLLLTEKDGQRALLAASGLGGGTRLILHHQGLGGSEGPVPTLREGMVFAWEPMFAVGGQAFYLEDMVLVTRTGAEVLNPGLPYTADEIERAMHKSRP